MLNKYDERILESKENTISIGFTLKNIQSKAINKPITELGGILYSKKVMGSRIIAENN